MKIVCRLRGDQTLCQLIVEMLEYFVKSNANKDDICRVYMRRIDHLYYKVRNRNGKRNLIKILKIFSSSIPLRCRRRKILQELKRVEI